MRENDSSIINLKQIFWGLLPAQILSIIAGTLGNLVNGLLIGNNFSEESMAALGFVSPLIVILSAVSMIISSGARVYCGHVIGRGTPEKMNDAFTVSILSLTALGIVLTPLIYGLARPISFLLGASGSVVDVTSDYIRGIALGVIPLLLVSPLMIYLQMGNRSTYAMLSTLVMALFTLILGFINVRFLKKGMFYMGLASSLSQLITTLFLFAGIFFGKNQVRFVGKNLSKDVLKEILSVGLPAALASILYSGRNIVINTIAGKIGGASAVSALTILNTSNGFYDAFNSGFSSACLILFGIFAGEKDTNSLKKFFCYSMKVGLVIAAVKLAVYMAGGGVIAGLFVGSTEVIEEAKRLMFCYSLCVPVNIVLLLMTDTALCMNRTKYCLILTVLSATIFPIGWMLVMKGAIGIWAVWTCYAVADTLALIIMCVVPSVKYKHPAVGLNELLMLTDMEADIKSLSMTVRTQEDVVSVSEALVNFCEENGVGSRNSYICGLCMEEMAGNAVKHGFKKEKKKQEFVVDLFVMITKDSLSLRLRDNAAGFDPHTRLCAPDPEDPCKNIGIRMVAGISKEMNYQSCFGMNVLTIKLY